MRAVLVANRSDCDPGFVGHSLRARGYSFTEFIREDHQNWPDLDGYDLVVSMGSSWSTYWSEVAEAVQAEQALLAQAIERGLSVLGICFGAQQLSVVLGGEVTKAQSPEIGWYQVFPVAETSVHAPLVLTKAPWMQWHSDRFSVPPGATVLAESPVGPQAMLCGRALGLQFHPEVTETIIRSWSSGEGEAELATVGLTPDGLMAQTHEHVQTAMQHCDEVVGWFLESVAQRHEH